MAVVLQIGGDTKAAVASAKELSLTLKQQQQVLVNLRYEYAYLTAEQRKSDIGKEMASDIKIANAEIQLLKANATSSFGAVGRGATKAFSAVRQFAYILPGIGVAGIFGAAFSGIEKLFDSVSSASSRLTETIGAAKNKFVDAASAVTMLKTDIGLARAGFISKDGVVKEYNETLGKTFGLVHSLDEAEQGFVRNGNAYIQITLQKAVANIAASKAAETYFKILEQQRKPFDPKASGFATISGFDIQAETLKKLNKELLDYQKIASGAEASAAILSKTFGANFFGDTKAKKFKIDWHDMFLQIPNQRVTINLAGTAALDLDRVKLVLMDSPKLDTFKEKFEKALSKSLEGIVFKPDFSASFTNAGAFKKMQEDMIKLAALGKTVGETMAAAFGKVFDAVAGGQNVFKALGEAVKGLVLDLIKAAIQSAIVATIMNLIVPGSGSIGKGAGGIFAGLFGGHAAGGPVAAGRPTWVGETGKELFVPSTSGRIVANNQLDGIQGAAMQSSTQYVPIFKGTDLYLMIKRTERYMNSNV